MLLYKICVGAPTIILNNELISELGLVFYGSGFSVGQAYRFKYTVV